MAPKRKPAKKPSRPPAKSSYEGARAKLLKLRAEIEDDLAAGSIEQHDYDFCKQQIEASLRKLPDMTSERKPAKKQPAKRPSRPPAGSTYEGARAELLKLRAEIEDDLAAGDIEQHDYDFCKQQIEVSLRKLDEPLPPAQRPRTGGRARQIRVVAIPRKQIDYDKLAMAILMMAKNKLREQRGEPPVEYDDKEAMADLMLARIRQQATERENTEKKP